MLFIFCMSAISVFFVSVVFNQADRHRFYLAQRHIFQLIPIKLYPDGAKYAAIRQGDQRTIEAAGEVSNAGNSPDALSLLHGFSPLLCGDLPKKSRSTDRQI